MGDLGGCQAYCVDFQNVIHVRGGLGDGLAERRRLIFKADRFSCSSGWFRSIIFKWYGWALHVMQVSAAVGPVIFNLTEKREKASCRREGNLIYF